MNPCFCWNIKDGAVTVGLWSLVYSLTQLGLFGWQSQAIKYYRDLAGNQLLIGHNTYGHFNAPTLFENYYQTPSTNFYTGLFIIQILCLIAAFFLMFASAALIYGAHTYSRCLIWPWIPCMLASILCSLAYCIMWWTGDVRDYWLVLTILEMITIFINLYCLLVIILFHRSMNGEIKHYRNKQQQQSVYRPDMYDEYRKDNYYMSNRQPEMVQPAYRYNNLAPDRDKYNRIPATQGYIPSPIIKSRKTTAFDDDLVSSWVKEQQALKDFPEHAESEPVIPSRRVGAYPLQHARSVPSVLVEMSAESSCRHDRYSKRHRNHRHKHRSKSRTCEHCVRRRHRSSSRHHHQSESLDVPSCSSESTEFTESSHRPRRHRSRSHDRGYGSDRLIDDRSPTRRTRERHSRSGPRKVKRGHGRYEPKDSPDAINAEQQAAAVAIQTDLMDSQLPPIDSQHGFTFPQQIIIPPSQGSIGPDGQLQPQTYQINSEIRISYDRHGRPVQHETVPLERDTPALQSRGRQPSLVANSPTHHQPQSFSISSTV